MSSERYCPHCKEVYPENKDYFYPARPRAGHKVEGWQSNCRKCWRDINHEAYLKRKAAKS